MFKILMEQLTQQSFLLMFKPSSKPSSNPSKNSTTILMLDLSKTRIVTNSMLPKMGGKTLDYHHYKKTKVWRRWENRSFT